jgi:hypothetical protein
MGYAATIDPAFTNDEKGAIEAALDDWTASVPELHVETNMAACDGSAAGTVCIRRDMAPTDLSAETVGATSSDAAGAATVVLYVERIDGACSDPNELLEQTMAHEMGHVLGLRHSSPGELMAPNVGDQAHRVTPADVAQFWAIRGR